MIGLLFAKQQQSIRFCQDSSLVVITSKYTFRTWNKGKTFHVYLMFLVGPPRHRQRPSILSGMSGSGTGRGYHHQGDPVYSGGQGGTGGGLLNPNTSSPMTFQACDFCLNASILVVSACVA